MNMDHEVTVCTKLPENSQLEISIRKRSGSVERQPVTSNKQKSTGNEQKNIFGKSVTDGQAAEAASAPVLFFTPASTLAATNSEKSANKTPGPSVEAPLQSEFEYNMQHASRGYFVIFNHEEFNQMSLREGTEKDAKALSDLATAMGFRNVEVHKDFNLDELKSKFTFYANQDHTKNDCFVCAILTHGQKDDFLLSRDLKYKLSEMTSMFTADKCSSLAGKPKLFFIQACRGQTVDVGANVEEDVPDSYFIEDESKSNTIPVEADFLLAHSTPPNFFAWRNKGTGSIFIQTLCQKFLKYRGELNLLEILTRVNHQIARDYEVNATDPKFQGMKQIPSFTSQLTKKVYFR